MSDRERRLLTLLKERSLHRGRFQLASGAISDYFIDGKMTVVCSEGANLIGNILYEHTKDLDIHAIGGPQVGAIPLATAAVMTYHQHGRSIEGFWVRDEVKSHGTRKRIEGGLNPGSRVAIVDDVFTTGKSALKAIQAVRLLECAVVLVLGLVDRLQGAGALLRDNGVEDYRTIFTIRDLQSY